jgi:predicted phosphoadenosine phosphosulfate sulfurtransferase
MEKKIKAYINFWQENCYRNGIPETACPRLEQLNKVPSYKLICKAILKNDFHLETLGLVKPVSKHYSSFKRVELQNRNGYLYTLSLF